MHKDRPVWTRTAFAQMGPLGSGIASGESRVYFLRVDRLPATLRSRVESTRRSIVMRMARQRKANAASFPTFSGYKRLKMLGFCA